MSLLKAIPLLFALLSQPSQSTTEHLLPPSSTTTTLLPLDKILSHIEEKSSCKEKLLDNDDSKEIFYCSIPLGELLFRNEIYTNATLSYFVTKEKKSGMTLSLFKFTGDEGIVARILYDGGEAGEFDGTPDRMIYKQVRLNDLTNMLIEGSTAVNSAFTHPAEGYEIAFYQAALGRVFTKKE